LQTNVIEKNIPKPPDLLFRLGPGPLRGRAPLTSDLTVILGRFHSGLRLRRQALKLCGAPFQRPDEEESVQPRQQVFSVNRFKPDNSFYSTNSKETTLGLGGVDDAEDADVILHEYGHSIQDNQAPGFGTTLEAGSMSEGFGDYWGARWARNSAADFRTPAWLSGTQLHPVLPTRPACTVWTARSIIQRTCAANADRVILQHHFLFPPNASFNQGVNALVMAAISLGYNNHQVNSIKSILRNRGFTVTV